MARDFRATEFYTLKSQSNGTRAVASGLVVRDYLAPLEEFMLEVKDYLAPLANFMLEVRDYLAPHVEFMLDVENDQVLGSNGVLIAIICFWAETTVLSVRNLMPMKFYLLLPSPGSLTYRQLGHHTRYASAYSIFMQRLWGLGGLGSMVGI